MPIITNNKIVNTTLSVLVVCAFTLIMLASASSLYVFLKLLVLSYPETVFINRVSLIFKNFQPLAVSITGVFGQVALVVITILCMKNNKSELTKLGTVVFVILIMGILLSAIQLFYWDVTDRDYLDIIAGRSETIANIISFNQFVLASFLAYLALFLGINKFLIGE